MGDRLFFFREERKMDLEGKMSIRRLVPQIKKVFAHAYMMPEALCCCRVKSLVAVSEDGKEFSFEVDQTDYSKSASEMWEAFCAYCRELGLQRGRDEVWFSSSDCERFDGKFVPCPACKFSVCFSLGDNFEYLGNWETMHMEYEYPEKCIHLAHPVSFEEFKAQSGYDVSREPYAGLELYRKFSAEIDKERYTEEECERMAKYIADEREGLIFDPVQCVDILLRLWKSSPALYLRSYELLWSGYENGSEEERDALDCIAKWLSEEEQAITDNEK